MNQASFLSVLFFSLFLSGRAPAQTAPQSPSHIERELQAESEQFLPAFDSKIYSHYTGLPENDNPIKRQAVVDCYGLRPKFIQNLNPVLFLFRNLEPMTGYYLMTRYGEIEKTETNGKNWKAPYCVHDLELLGPIRFIKITDIFTGNSAFEDCEFAKARETLQPQVIRSFCEEHSEGGVKKVQLETLLIRSIQNNQGR